MIKWRKPLKFFTLLFAMFGVVAFFAQPAFAAEYEITIDNIGLNKNQDVIFEYNNIGPGFQSDAPVVIVDNADQPAEVKLISIVEDSTDPNVMAPYVQLSLLWEGAVIASGTLADPVGLLGAAICVPANSTDTLMTRFNLPQSVGNLAQNTSMKVIYTFQITTGPCETVTPDEPSGPGVPDTSNPNVLPPTGETMWLFWALGGIAIVSLVTMLVFWILMILKKRKHDKKSKKKDSPSAEPAADFAIDEDKPPRKKVKGVRRILRILTDVFFVLCLLALAAATAMTIAAKKSGEAVEIAGFRPYMIATGSMEPVFRVDGLVITHYDDFDDVKVGDVVAFRAEGLKGQSALHRVIAIVDDGQSKKFIVKGDNNPHPDGAAVTRENYIGRMAWQTNWTAVFFNTLQGPGGFWRAIVLPLATLVLLYLAIRWLVGSSSSWQSKGLAIGAVTLMVSGSVLLSYSLYNAKKIEMTNQSLAKIAGDFADSCHEKKWQVAGKDVLGRIEIPKIGLDYPIIDYVSATSLNISITHFSGADINRAGNNVLAGHRTFGRQSPFNIFFTQIDHLESGDEIWLTDAKCGREKYVVTDFETVAPDDTSVLEQSADGKKYLTLISCTYDLKNRYIVKAVAAEES